MDEKKWAAVRSSAGRGQVDSLSFTLETSWEMAGKGEGDGRVDVVTDHDSQADEANVSNRFRHDVFADVGQPQDALVVGMGWACVSVGEWAGE